MKGGLRALVCGIGAALIAGGGLLWIAGCGAGTALRLLVPGLIVSGAVSFERWRYRRIGDDRPGRGWIATGERFADPETGRRVTVYHHPATGERCYVAATGSAARGGLAEEGAPGYDSGKRPRSSGG